jgi:glycosyltransferase involved in cell wall biosynthesis
MGLIQMQYYMLDEIAFNKSNHIITFFESFAVYFQRRGLSATCITPGIKLGPWKPTEKSEKVNIFFGALDLNNKRKGLKFFLQAISLIEKNNNVKTPYKINLVGKYDNSLIKQITTLGLEDKINLYGLLNRTEFIEILKSSDLLVVPSLYEEWGCVVTEALSLGIPVVAFDTKPFNGIITKEIGILSPPRDSVGLSNSISTLIDNSKLRTQMSFSARQYAEKNYDYEVLIKKVEGVYRHTK